MRTKEQNSIIHIYTGDGKGKTTAALGLALRAIGAGKKVAIVQFLKQGGYSEHKAIEKYKLPIKIHSFGMGFYKILGDKHPKSLHQKEAKKAFNKSKEIIESGKYDLVILDEINVAIGFGLINVDEVIAILKPKARVRKSEIVLTGRRAHRKLKNIAELVSNIKKEKHYFDKGFKARKGIDL